MALASLLWNHLRSFQKTDSRQKDQWERTESQEINPPIYGKLIFKKGTMKIQWGKNNLFNKW